VLIKAGLCRKQGFIVLYGAQLSVWLSGDTGWGQVSLRRSSKTICFR